MGHTRGELAAAVCVEAAPPAACNPPFHSAGRETISVDSSIWTPCRTVTLGRQAGYGALQPADGNLHGGRHTTYTLRSAHARMPRLTRRCRSRRNMRSTRASIMIFFTMPSWMVVCAAALTICVQQAVRCGVTAM